MDASPEPEAPLGVRRPPPDAGKLHEVRLPPPLVTDVDIVALLLEERQADR